MNHVIRAAAESGALAFAFAAMAVAMLSVNFFTDVGVGNILAVAAALGFLAGGSVFFSALACATSRFPDKSPVGRPFITGKRRCGKRLPRSSC
jgi:hypothetical protein